MKVTSSQARAKLILRGGRNPTTHSTRAFAIADFRFLIEQGYADELTWVFRDDLWFRGPDDVLMRYPPPLGNVPLAKKVYDEGRERGLVEIKAVATANNRVAVTVWFPRLAEEEVQGWSQGLKLILQPLPAAKVISGLRWRVAGFMWLLSHPKTILACRKIGRRSGLQGSTQIDHAPSTRSSANCLSKPQEVGQKRNLIIPAL